MPYCVPYSCRRCRWACQGCDHCPGGKLTPHRHRTHESNPTPLPAPIPEIPGVCDSSGVAEKTRRADNVTDHKPFQMVCASDDFREFLIYSDGSARCAMCGGTATVPAYESGGKGELRW
jgi:hypothetical protein